MRVPVPELELVSDFGARLSGRGMAVSEETMRMLIDDQFRNAAGEWESLRPIPFAWANAGGWESAAVGQRELLKRWHGRGVTKYRNGIEFPNSPLPGMRQLIWFEETRA